MRVLALDAFHTGSHRAFIEGWIARSRHDWTLLTLPGRHWKWRMRSAPIAFIETIDECGFDRGRFDSIYCTDMLDLAAFRGLLPDPLARTPAVAYFHENQFAYPTRLEGAARERDAHFAFTNVTTALAADRVWFNSAFNRDSFIAGANELLASAPEPPESPITRRIAASSSIEPPAIEPMPEPARPREPGPLRICWAHRWEHDKGPDILAHALDTLARRTTDFRLSVLGQRYRETPEPLIEIKQRLGDRIDDWGYVPSRADYTRALARSDVFISTARQEFFGIAVVEAVHAGCFPLVPRDLAYPEVLAPLAESDESIFHDGSPESLADALLGCIERLPKNALWPGDPLAGRAAMERYLWDRRVSSLDDAIESAAHRAEAT